MATLKLRHLLLYFTTFLLLYISPLQGTGALLAMAAWMQICILLWKLKYSARNQARVFVYFLTLIPLFLFLGSSSSFILIYLKEGSLLFLIFSFVITFILCFFTALLSIFIFRDFDRAKNINEVYSIAFQNIKNKKRKLTASALFLLFIILIPIPVRQDFKIVLSIILIHLFLHRKQVRLLIGRRALAQETPANDP